MILGVILYFCSTNIIIYCQFFGKKWANLIKSDNLTQETFKRSIKSYIISECIDKGHTSYAVLWQL